MRLKIYRSENNMSKINKSYLEELISNYHGIVGSKLEDVVDSKNGRYVICVFDKYDDMCGFVSIVESEKSINISDAYIEFGTKERDLENRIIKTIIQLAKDHKKQYIDVQVASKNADVRKFYENLGYLYESASVNKYITMKQFISHDISNAGYFLNDIESTYGKENFVDNVAKHLLANDIDERYYRVCEASKIIASGKRDGLKNADETVKLYVDSYELYKNHKKISEKLNSAKVERAK